MDRKIKKKKEDEENYIELQFKHSGREFWIPYKNLSTSEKAMLLLDLAITTAQEISKQRLTLLLIDELTYNFDKHNFEKLIKALSKGDFQVLSVIPPRLESSILVKNGEDVELQEWDYLESWKVETLTRSE